MTGYELPVPSFELCRKLSEDLRSESSDFPIEKIHFLLAGEYTFEQLCVLEAEFILQHIYRNFPELENAASDSVFISKLYAIPAILKQPLLITQSLLAFYNTVMVCNDLPSGIMSEEDIKTVPSRYLFRTFLAVNAMLPDDMDFYQMYLHPNIKRFIYDTYSLEDNLILDPSFTYLQDEFLNHTYSTVQADRFRTILAGLESEMLEIQKRMVLSVCNLPAGTEAGEDDYGLYQTVYNASDSLIDIKLRLYKNKYYGLENTLLKKYPQDSYEGRLVRAHLANLLYGYTYWQTAEGMKDRRLVIAVDYGAVRGREASASQILANLAGSERTVERLVFCGESDENNAAAFMDSALEGSEFSVVISGNDIASMPDYINEYAYDKWGPPSRLIILSSSASSSGSVIKSPGFKTSFPGWQVTVLT